MSAKFRYILHSDGGGERNGTGAGACILHDEESGRVVRFLVVLGQATNNEAEITAGLIGLAAIQAASGDSLKTPIRWVSDSEYVLKSATAYILNWQKNGWRTAAKAPVKNQGLWRAYLSLSNNLQITTEHVYGHQGHVENELCDGACNWVQDQGEGVLSVYAPNAAVEIEGNVWHLIEGRKFLANLRQVGISEQQVRDAAVELIATARLILDRPDSESQKSVSSKNQARKTPTRKMVIEKLVQASDLAEQGGEKELAKSIRMLVKQFN